MSFPRHPSGAFSLVEVTLALGIAVFCLVVIFGLLSVGVNMSSVSVEQTAATNILATVASDLRTAPNPLPKGQAANTLIYQLYIPAAVLPTQTSQPAPTPSSFPAVYLDANGQNLDSSGQKLTAAAARYQLSGYSRQGVGREATMMHIVLTWPPGAPANKKAGSVEALVALDRN